MRELRCLVFTHAEIASAILERRRRTGQGIPETDVEKLTFRSGDDLTAVLHMRGRDGTPAKYECQARELTAALVRACMDRKIPMPVHAEKFVQLLHGTITLMITLNFNKTPRLKQSSR